MYLYNTRNQGVQMLPFRWYKISTFNYSFTNLLTSSPSLIQSKEHKLLVHNNMFNFVNQLPQPLDDSLFSFRYLFIVLHSSTIKHKK